MKLLLTNLRKYYTELIFFGFGLRMIVLGATIGDAIAMISMVAIYGFDKYLSNKKVDDLNQINEKLENLQNAISSVKLSQGLVTKKVTSNDQSQNKRFF